MKESPEKGNEKNTSNTMNKIMPHCIPIVTTEAMTLESSFSRRVSSSLIYCRYYK